MIAAVLALVSCSDSQGSSAPSGSPAPTSLSSADPCSFLERSVLAANGLKQESPAYTGATARSCRWASRVFATMVLVRWDSQVLVDFAQAFPTPVSDDVNIEGQRIVLGKSDERPACAGAFIAQKGTVVEVIVGMYVEDNESAPNAHDACELVKRLSGPVIRQIRAQHLLDTKPAIEPTS